MSDSLWPHESQHAKPPCPSPILRVHSNSCPSSRWCHPAISFSVVPFSSCPQSLPASGSFPMSQLFTWGGQSIGVSASASVLPVNTQDWSPLRWTGWISLQSKELSIRYSVHFSSVAQSCPTLCDPMNSSTPGLRIHHQLPEFTQTHIHQVGDAIQPSHPLSSPSPPAPYPSQHQSLFQWVNSSHEVAIKLGQIFKGWIKMSKSINVVNKIFFEELDCTKCVALIGHTNFWDITPILMRWILLERSSLRKY